MYRSNTRGRPFSSTIPVKYDDYNGNYIMIVIMNVTVETISCILVNVYNPDTDSPQFYKEPSNKFEDIYST